MYLEKYGFRISDLPDNAAGIPARITAVYRERFEIVCEKGTGFARLKTGAYRSGEEIPTTGDFVLLDWQADGESRILRTLPRRTFFSRLDPSSSGRKEQAVAANFDYALILQSLDRDFNPRRLERYVTLAWQSGATPAVVLTKLDGAEDAAGYELAAAKAAVGVDIFTVSSKTGQGIERLLAYLKPGRTAVFLGSSGVGKSTLVNALAGEERMATGNVREKDGRGRHTTSHRQLLLLKSGVMIIDTPGMREIGMWDVSEGLSQSFSDVERYLGRCKFSDCRHQSEPGCAVAEAIRRGELSPARWESYVKLHAEARFTEDKAGYLREKQRRFKEISKLVKQMKTPDYRFAPCTESFPCKACGALITPEDAGSRHRNHCPRCLSSVHADRRPGDRASLCKGIMDPVAVWVRKNGEWAVIHRCRSCGALSSNRIAADDNPELLMAMAMRPLTMPLETAGEQPASPRAAALACKLCGTAMKADGHCPQCLSGVHAEGLCTDGATRCEGRMDPVAVRIREEGAWSVILRCRSCGGLRESPAAAGDNAALLLSIAMKPLAAPPFPLWKLEERAAPEAQHG